MKGNSESNELTLKISFFIFYLHKQRSLHLAQTTEHCKAPEILIDPTNSRTVDSNTRTFIMLMHLNRICE